MSESFEIPDGTMPETLIPSPDATRAAYVVRDKYAMHVEISGAAKEQYRGVAGLTFSPDSSQVAYAAVRDGAWFVVFGEKVHGPYLDVGKTSPVISGDSRRVAYTALLPAGWVAAIDGEIVDGPYEGFSAGGVLFSDDSRRTAYAAKVGDAWTVMVDGAEVGRHAGVVTRSLVFSPDSARFAYMAGERAGRFLRRKTVARLILDGRTGPDWPYDLDTGAGVGGEVVFSPDSQRLAYAVGPRGKWSWVVDGEVGPQTDGFVSGRGGDPMWKQFPDHGKMACRPRTGVFSPDSRHFAYGAVVGGEHVFIWDGSVQARHEAILNWPVVFSADSAHVAYGAQSNDEQFIVLDGEPLGRHHGITGDRGFNADSTRFAYVAMADERSYHLVVGPRRWDMPGGPPAGVRLVWGDVDRLHTLVAKGRMIVLVRYRTG